MMYEKSQGWGASTSFSRSAVLIISVLSVWGVSSSISIYSPNTFLAPWKYTIQLDRRKKAFIQKNNYSLIHNEVLLDLLWVTLKRPTLRHRILAASGLSRWKEHFLTATWANEYLVIHPNLGYVKLSGCKLHMCLLKAMIALPMTGLAASSLLPPTHLFL